MVVLGGYYGYPGDRRVYRPFPQRHEGAMGSPLVEGLRYPGTGGFIAHSHNDT